MMAELLKDVFNPITDSSKTTMEIVEEIKKALNKTQTSSALFIAVIDSDEENGVISLVENKEEELDILLNFEKLV